MATKKTNPKNLLEDKKGWESFAETLKKDIKQSQKGNKTSHGSISEIICTEKDIGKPLGSENKKKK